jgi:hypothetical protein
MISSSGRKWRQLYTLVLIFLFLELIVFYLVTEYFRQ